MHACINKNGIIILSICNAQTSFDKNRITVGCFILNLLVVSTNHMVCRQDITDLTEFYFTVKEKQKEKEKKDQLFQEH